MPLYEYRCEQDGTVLELRRSMADADKPVPDPEYRGRTFRRVLSGFQAKSSTPAASSLPQACCPCGQAASRCPSMN
ncbi:MAG: FmdB family zinc ribbon protein [Planctomycetota bacterium]